MISSIIIIIISSSSSNSSSSIGINSICVKWFMMCKFMFMFITTTNSNSNDDINSIISNSILLVLHVLIVLNIYYVVLI